jgi:hypothetical protein
MKILFKYPTRERPLLFSKTLVSWYNNMELNNFEFLVSCDKNDATMNNETMINYMRQFPNLSVSYEDNASKIEACNQGVKEKNFDVVVLVSDDMVPEIHGYDRIIVDSMKQHFPDTDGALWFFDGYNDVINTLSILGRKYFDRFEYIYHPSYITQWCDQEHTDIASGLGKLVKFNEVIVRHVHPEIVVKQREAAAALNNHIPEYTSQGFAGHDKLWLKNANGDADMINYYSRKERGFPV